MHRIGASERKRGATTTERACQRARERGTNVAIIIDMLACKRCLLYAVFCQSVVVAAIFQGRVPSLAVPKSNFLLIYELDVNLARDTTVPLDQSN